VGRHLTGGGSLAEWFLSSRGDSVKGFTRAYFSGLSNIRLAREIERIVLLHPELEGLYHISGPRISKHDLLSLLARYFRKSIEVEPDDSVSVDRSLDCSSYRATTGYELPTWEEMIDEMAAIGPQDTLKRCVS
jgi:dTDP-4-dehydrorhamnose reductase